MLKTIRLSNFKSLSDEPVLLGNFNVFIGANSTGKSNFVDALRFIHDILSTGLSSAVGQRFGWKNVLTRDKKRADKITAEIFYDLKGTAPLTNFKKERFKPVNCRYTLEIGCSRRQLYLNSETLKIRYNTRNTEGFQRSRDKVDKIKTLLFPFPASRSLKIPIQNQHKPFLQTEFLFLGASLLPRLIKSWCFYELDVTAARHPCIDMNQNILLDDGRNLAEILCRLTAKSAQSIRSRIEKIMSILIPGFSKWEIESQFDGSLGFRIREKGISHGFLPQMVSEGTIRLLSMLIALLYHPTKTSLICIDEPERYLHPQVLQPLVEIMREVSKTTQLIITTHSAKLVKWLQPNEVFMVDKINRITRIKHAQDISMINKFLEQFSLDELWLQGYLKGGRIF